MNPHSIATLRYPGAAGYITKARLVAADRCWSVVADRGTVTLLAVGGSTYARDLGAGSNVVAELDAAADHGFLLTAAIAFTRQQDNTASAREAGPVTMPGWASLRGFPEWPRPQVPG